jgi:hypothetical protein
MPQRVYCLLILLFLAPLPAARAGELRGCHLTVYGAVMTDGALAETAVLTADLDRDYRFAVVALGKKVGSWKDWIDFELEGQIGRHLKGQHHWEFNALFIARWLRFPWNETLRTSFAVGEGLSLATRTPAFEQQFHGERTNPLLNYLMFEFAFALPELPRWSLVTRIHHRSGIYGTFNGVHGASNALGLGLRYHF